MIRHVYCIFTRPIRLDRLGTAMRDLCHSPVLPCPVWKDKPSLWHSQGLAALNHQSKASSFDTLAGRQVLCLTFFQAGKYSVTDMLVLGCSTRVGSKQGLALLPGRHPNWLLLGLVAATSLLTPRARMWQSSSRRMKSLWQSTTPKVTPAGAQKVTGTTLAAFDVDSAFSSFVTESRSAVCSVCCLGFHTLEAVC